MKIAWTTDIEDAPELEERWRSAIAKTHAFSKVALIEFLRREVRLNILLNEIEQEYAISEVNDKEAGVLQRRLYWWWGSMAVLACLLWVLDASDIWKIGEAVLWVIVAGFLLNIVLTGYSRNVCRNETVVADRKIAVATFEFEEISSVRLSYYDLEFLDDNVSRAIARNIEKFVSRERRRAELSVTVMESLVRRIEMLDTAG